MFFLKPITDLLKQILAEEKKQTALLQQMVALLSPPPPGVVAQFVGQAGTPIPK